MRRGIVLAALLAAVGGSLSGSASSASSALQPLWCTARSETPPDWKCSELAFVGNSILDLEVVGNDLYAVVGSPIYGIQIARYREAGGRLQRASCYGREAVEPPFGRSDPVRLGCTIAPSSIPNPNLWWYHDFAPRSVASSPDGRNLYADSFDPEWGKRIEVLRRDAGGDLTFKSCVTDGEALSASPCSSRMAGRLDAKVGRPAVSRDGNRVYAVGTYGLYVFDRQADGDLRSIGCARMHKTTCAPPGNRNLAGFQNSVAVSPDSRHVYVLDTYDTASGYRIAVDVFARVAGPPGLRKLQTIAVSPDLGDGEIFALSPNGRWLYVPSTERLTVFARNTKTGRLTWAWCLISQRAADVKGCARAAFAFDGRTAAMSVSRDGKTVLLVGTDVFAFTPAGGAKLRQVGCVPHFRGVTSGARGCSRPWPPFNISGTFMERAVAFSGGRTVYVSNSSSLTTIRR